jgi:hypothetical protein
MVAIVIEKRRFIAVVFRRHRRFLTMEAFRNWMFVVKMHLFRPFPPPLRPRDEIVGADSAILDRRSPHTLPPRPPKKAMLLGAAKLAVRVQAIVLAVKSLLQRHFLRWAMTATFMTQINALSFEEVWTFDTNIEIWVDLWVPRKKRKIPRTVEDGRSRQTERASLKLHRVLLRWNAECLSLQRAFTTLKLGVLREHLCKSELDNSQLRKSEFVESLKLGALREQLRKSELKNSQLRKSEFDTSKLLQQHEDAWTQKVRRHKPYAIPSLFSPFLSSAFLPSSFLLAFNLCASSHPANLHPWSTSHFACICTSSHQPIAFRFFVS